MDYFASRERIARCLVASPQEVIEELRSYGQSLDRSPFFVADDAFEASLLLRKDPQINLALARVAADTKVIRELFALGSSPKSTEMASAYSAGLRLACLRNEHGISLADSKYPERWLGAEGLEEILTGEDDIEIAAVLQNPSLGSANIVAVLARAASYANMDDSRWLNAVMLCGSNPRFRIDESSEHGPDLVLGNIQKALFNFLLRAPVDDRGTVVANHVLAAQDPAHVRAPDGDACLAMFEHWRAAKTTGYGGEARDGNLAENSLEDETRCLLGALYGAVYEKTGKGTGTKGWERRLLGRADSEDLISRCAYYGKADLTQEEMEKGLERDHDLFLLALTCNSRIYRRETRAFAEPHLNTWLLRRYSEMCKRYAEKQAGFDPRPVTEVVDDPVRDQPTPLQSLEGRVESIERSIKGIGVHQSRIGSWLVWGFILLAVVTWLAR